MKHNITTAGGKRSENTEAYAFFDTLSNTSITLILFLLLLTFSSIPVYAAEVTPRSVAIGESVLIRTTPGANGLVLYCDGQSFRFLGELEQTTAYKPSQLGTCTLQETQRDGSIVMSEFYVVDTNAPHEVPSILPEGQNAGGQNTDSQTIAGQGTAASIDDGVRGTPGTITTDGTRNDGTTRHNESTNNTSDSSVGGSSTGIEADQRLYQTRLQELFLREAMDEDPRLGTALLSRAWRKSAIAPQGTLAGDERALSVMNRGVRAYSTRGTGWDAQVTIRTPGGRISGSTSDLGVSKPGGRGSVTFEFQERHVKRLTLDDANLNNDISIGIDEPEPSTIDPPHNDETVIKAYAIDPSAISFTSGSATMVAEGTALYKCKDWVFYDRTCAGTWERVMDLTPGQEYDVALSPTDPGFIESTITQGVPTAQSTGEMVVLGSVSAPVKNTQNRWGIVFLNPSNQTLNITWVRFRSSLSTFASITAVKPSSGWVFSSATMVNWTGSVLVGPQEAAEFIVNITGVNANQLNSIITVQVNASGIVYTNAGYVTHATNSALQYPSVYFVNSTNTSAYAVSNVTQNESADYTLRIHNAGTTTIPIGTMHNIYIPPGWRNVTMAPQTGWTTGTVMGDEGSGWYLLPQITGTIAAGQWQNIIIGATPPQSNDIELYNWQVKLIGPSAQTARIISSSFEPALRVVNDTPLLAYEDGRYEETRVGGGSRYVDQYASIPAPGDSPGVNRWAVVVVNPTDDPINVTQLDITSNVNIFTGGRGITPTVTWSNISQSNHRWNGTVTIPPHGAAEFASNIVLTATTTTRAIITITTQTSAGTITSSGFPTGQSTGSIQYPAVYAVEGSAYTNVVNTTSDTKKQFLIRINNSGSSATIPIGTRLEITLPPGWRDIVAITTATNWTVDQVITDASGGSTIRARTLGSTIATNGFRDFIFNATSPIVGTNSTYRFDILFFGGTAQTTTQPIQTHTQLAARVTTTTFGLNITRRSENLTDIGNITSVRIRSIASSQAPTYFNFSIRRPGTGAWETLRNGTLDATWSEWIIALATNRTYDSREYIDRDTGSSNYSAVLVRWYTASNNQTSLREDLLEINVTYDQSVPSISLVSPDNLLYTNATSTLFQADTADDYDLKNCSVSLNGVRNITNSTPVNASTTTFNISGFADGKYNWSVDCYDLVGNRNMTANRTMTVDTTPPTVVLNTPAVDARLTSSTVTFNITPYDQNIANCSLLIDDIINETNMTPVSGQNIIFSADIIDGNHSWTAECSDLAGNTYRNATRNFSIDTIAPMYGTATVSPASDSAYNPELTYEFVMGWTDANGISSVILEENTTGFFVNHTATTSDGENYSVVLGNVSAGSYGWRMYANDTYNNWNMTAMMSYTVLQAQSELALYLNDTTENYPVDVNESVNITAVTVTPSYGEVLLYVNGTLVGTGSGAVRNITSFNTTGVKNITAVYLTTKNYTGTTITLFVVVGDKFGPSINQTYPPNGSYVKDTNITFTFNVSDQTNIDNCTVWVRNITDTTVWWDSRWSNRQRVTVTEQSGSTLMNYSTQLFLNKDAFNLTLAKSDGSDLRIIILNDSGQQEAIPYWIEYWNTTIASVWTLIPSITANGNRTLYLYYGNPAAQTTANGSGVFTVFDGFTTNKIGSYWQSADNDLVAGTLFAVTNGTLNITAGGADTWTGNDEYGSVFKNITGDFSAVVRINSQQNVNAWAKAGIMVRNNMSARASSLGYAFAAITPGNGYAWQRDSAAVNGFLDTNSVAGSPSIYPSMVRLFKNGTTFGMHYSKDSGQTWSQVGPNQSLPSANTMQDIGLSVTSHAGTTLSSVIFDNFYARAYATIDPTISIDALDAFVPNATSTGPYSNPDEGAIDTYGFSESAYQSKISCYDPLGNIGVSNIAAFTTDFAPPSPFSLIAPSNNTVSKNQSPALAWQSSSDAHFRNYVVLIDNAFDFSSPNYIYNTTGTSYNSVSAIPSGVWYWRVDAYDQADNTMSAPHFAYIVDLIAPQYMSVSPQNNTYQNTTAVNVTFLFSDITAVTNCTLFFNDSTAYSNTTLNQTGDNSFIVTKTDGEYLWRVECVDEANNTNSSEERVLIIDTIPPTDVALLSPANNTFTNNNTPTLAWSQTIEPHFKNYTVIVSDNETFPYANMTYGTFDIASTVYYVITAWMDGTWYWKIIAYDLAGNSADPFFIYTIDSTSPTEFSLTSPADNTASNDRTPTLGWSGSSDQNFANYTILVTDSPSFEHINMTYNVSGNDTVEFTPTIDWTDNTVWRWKVIAYDNASNSRNSSQTFTYTTDTTAPIVRLVSPTNNTLFQSGSSSLITFKYNVSDLSDVSNCTITINDSSSIITTTDYFIAKDTNETFIQSLSSGNYNWSVECVDAAGNTGTSVKHNLSVNITLPKLRLYDTTASDVPTINTSANTTAMAVYVNFTGAARNSIPKYRQWNGVAWSAEGSLPTAGSPVRWVKVAAAPSLALADQVTAATLSDDGFIDMYLWNGSDWTAYNNVANIGTTNNAYRAYDVEYETQRGRPILISGNYTNSTCELRYHAWNGTGFGTGTCIDDPSISTAFTIGFVRVARNPGPLSNELALIYMDRTNSDARALVWNGSAWGQPRNITLTVSITTEECIGIAYEQSSKEILAVAGQGTVVAYSTYNGTAWDSNNTIDTNAATASTLNWMTLKPNPAGDDIMITVIDAQASPDLSAGRWTGSTWTATGQRDPGVDTQASRPADFEWEQTGNVGVMIYATAAGQLARQTYNTVSSWGAPSTLATGTNTHTWVLGAINPGTASGDVRSIFMSQEATSQQLDGAAWTGTTLIDQNAAFTINVGATTYQSFDLVFKRFAPQASQGSRNISLNESMDATTNMITATKANLTMLSNATSKPMSEYGTLGFSFPAGAGITFSALFGTMFAGTSYITWDAYKVNASGEYRLCGYGNKTRTGSDRQLGSSYGTVTASCTIPDVTRLQRDDTIRVYTYVNSTIDNIITKYTDSPDTYVELGGFPLGNLTLSIVAPTTDPLISEGENMTLICSANCSGGYCENVRVSGEINNTPTTFNDLSYTQGMIVLNSSAENPVIMGTINSTTNATYTLIGSEYSFNNTLRCSATSEWVNATSNFQNATVLDTVAPNVTLISPEDTSGWDPANFTFTFNASDRRIDSCTLWDNWSGTWAANETLVPNNGTPTSFSAIELLEYKTYIWNVRCNDTAGNSAFAASNYTFTIAGDMLINGSEINFSNSNPAEGSEITIFAFVRNRANRNENNVNVAFYLNDPQGANSTQIGDNITIPFLGALQNITVNVSYTALLGANEIFVVVDPVYGTGDIFESNEENNIGNTTLYVTIWQVYYGNTSGNISVGTGDNNTFVSWMIQNITGNIYISDSDTTNGIQFPLLRPMGRNTVGATTVDTTDDFEELDALLGTTGYDDNVTVTFTDAGTPRMTMSLQIYSSTVNNIPMINSTTDGNHTTGLLWDADDSTNGYYDITDREDIVFVTKIRANTSSAYGVNDFVGRIPSPLKSYKGTTDTVNLYYEIQ